jgi:hypothetical protein
MVPGKLQAAARAAESKTTATPSALFDRLTSGDLDVESYLDTRVDEAIAPIAGKVPAERIAWLRQMLRDQLLTFRRTATSAQAFGSGAKSEIASADHPEPSETIAIETSHCAACHCGRASNWSPKVSGICCCS